MTNCEPEGGATRDELLQRVALMEAMIAGGPEIYGPVRLDFCDVGPGVLCSDWLGSFSTVRQFCVRGVHCDGHCHPEMWSRYDRGAEAPAKT